MKSILTILLLSSCFFATAQISQDDIQLVQSMYGRDKREVVKAMMNIQDSAKSSQFWKAYEAYETDRKKIGSDYIRIIEDYANNYSKLTDAKADELVKKMAANNKANDDLLMKAYNKLKPSLGALNAAKFVQLENYLKTQIRAKVMDEIPFIGELEHSKKQ